MTTRRFRRAGIVVALAAAVGVGAGAVAFAHGGDTTAVHALRVGAGDASDRGADRRV